MRNKELYNEITGFMGKLRDDAGRSEITNMQGAIDYLVEKLHIYEEKLQAATGRKTVELDDGDRKRLASKARLLNTHLLEMVEDTWQPDTLMDWYRRLIADRYDSSANNAKRTGRPATPKNVVELILKFAAENTSWGYDRISSWLKYLGYDVSVRTVRRILTERGIFPTDWRKRHDWQGFFEAHRNVLAATDFLTQELLTPEGLQRVHVLFFEDVTTREVWCGGVSVNPDGDWMAQVARNQTDAIDGRLCRMKYLIHDNVETIPFPEELYDIPGLVGDVMNTTLRYSNKPNRPLALAGALALMSYLAARKVKSPTGLRPNVYLLALADSGSGKERPRDVNQFILEEIQKDDGLLDRVSSGEGIEDALKAYTSLFWMCDEFYSTLQEMMAEKKDTKDTMMEYLLKLYTNSHKFIKTRAKANLTPVKIRFPHLTLFATTTPDGFFENLREKFLLDGMYARLNVMVAEKGGRGRLPPELDVPQDIIGRARLWAHYTPPQAGNLSEQPLAVPYTADAERLAAELFERQEDECEKARKNEEPQWKISVWNRACEIALRYALIYACSIALKPEDTIITADAVRWGEKFMWWEIRNKFFLTERHYFRTDFERIAESVIDIMRRWHRKNGEETPMPGWKFNRKTKHLPPNCLNAVVESLGKQQRLFSGAWKNGTIYSLHPLK